MMKASPRRRPAGAKTKGKIGSPKKKRGAKTPIPAIIAVY
jgi:hypothetical protein